jgi:hypothetical protein
MKAVSPLRSASTMRNFLTDDSSEVPLSAGLRDLPPATDGVFEGDRPMTLPETESLELWPLSECWCAAAMDGSEAVAVAAVTEVVFPSTEPLDAASSVDDMSSSAPFRLSKDKAEDLVRRCELRARASADVNKHSNQTEPG